MAVTVMGRGWPLKIVVNDDNVMDINLDGDDLCTLGVSADGNGYLTMDKITATILSGGSLATPSVTSPVISGGYVVAPTLSGTNVYAVNALSGGYVVAPTLSGTNIYGTTTVSGALVQAPTVSSPHLSGGYFDGPTFSVARGYAQYSFTSKQVSASCVATPSTSADSILLPAAIPAGVFLRGAYLEVDTAIVGSGATTWAAYLSGAAGTLSGVSIGTGLAFAQGTSASKIFDWTALWHTAATLCASPVTTEVVNVVLSGNYPTGGYLSGGQVTGVFWYDQVQQLPL